MAPDNSMCVSHHCKQRRPTKVTKLSLFLNARKKAHAVHIVQESRAQRRQFTLHARTSASVYCWILFDTLSSHACIQSFLNAAYHRARSLRSVIMYYLICVLTTCTYIHSFTTLRYEPIGYLASYLIIPN